MPADAEHAFRFAFGDYELRSDIVGIEEAVVVNESGNAEFAAMIALHPHDCAAALYAHRLGHGDLGRQSQREFNGAIGRYTVIKKQEDPFGADIARSGDYVGRAILDLNGKLHGEAAHRALFPLDCLRVHWEKTSELVMNA